MAFLLDLCNILGGLLLAIPLLRRLPNVGDNLERFTDRVARWAWLIGIVALIAAGYFLIVHLFEGHIWHFEVVGIAVGLLLTWEKFTGRRILEAPGPAEPAGRALVIAIFGVIAIIVGIEGLFTPN
ncbi:hypothetical protein ACWT_2930 [Actinoplanes sp. SE50]|uniref:hypothetical protein n=1 Tax=unclassified Actinoplanes TaxID=2626549 RepID=UPI00023EC093|nr:MULTISPECIES: hypothetical protein [unclassified Actinoplanes]AEV83511.1 hypothetical protein ACPL_2616 [Actinoplanes sp. SE50/110]ATO82345.1 hypothetical protein ACWT_2930 [Actinoplanes sp. SE50]SLL99752.1 hypothetical protein ACSP50_2983 [Actinoplanes sp. SE50/110]